MTQAAPAPIAETISQFALARLSEGLPSEVEDAARRQLIDSVGVAIAGYREPTVESMRRLVANWGTSGRASPVGQADRMSTPAAALVGGTMAHALDFDDTHGPSVLHPSASVASAAFAAAQESDSSLDEVVRALAIGNEVVVRLGMAGVDASERDSIFFSRGFHATSICGCIGSATAAALISGCSEGQLRDAMSIASSFSSGLLEANRTGGTVKRVHCGWAAFSGLMARDMAMEGITGSPTFVEGRFGFLNAFCGDKADPDWVTRDLGSHWEMLRIGFKPYPINGFLTSTAEAALLMRARGFQPDHVERVEIRLPPPVLRTVAEPRDIKVRPTSVYSARFSAPFVFSLAFLGGGGGLGLAVEDFTEAALDDPTLLAMADRVHVVGDEKAGESFPGDVPAVVTVTLTDGTVVHEEVPHRMGGVQRPLEDAQVDRKFLGNTAPYLGEGRSIDALQLLRTAIDVPVSAVLDALLVRD